MSLRSYPTDFPVEAIGVLLTSMRGGATNRNQVIYSAYEVVGFGLGKTFPYDPNVNVIGAIHDQETFSPGELLGVSDAPPVTLEDVETAANQAQADEDLGVARGGFSGISPWMILMQAALQLLLKLRDNRR